MEGTPIVSVVIPAYNAAAYVAQAVGSALAQSYRDLEVILVDDGSQDDTVARASSAAAGDARFQVLLQHNQGVAAARNAGIRASKGTYIAPLDADDIWYPSKIESQVSALEAAGNRYGMVYSAWETIVPDGSVQRTSGIVHPHGDLSNVLVAGNAIACASTPLIRRSVLEEVGLYSEGMRREGGQGCEDWDLYLRIAEKYMVAYVPQYLLGYRLSEGSMSTSAREMERSYQLMISHLLARRSVPESLLRLSRQRFHVYLAGIYRRKRRRARTMLHLARAVGADAPRWLRRPPRREAVRTLVRMLLPPDRPGHG